MDDGLQKFLSSAPVLAVVVSTFFVGLFIEINRFFPDGLFTF
ncbi:MAG: Photosystem I reaction center subunit IX [Cyanobacteria bacterium J06642_2]